MSPENPEIAPVYIYLILTQNRKGTIRFIQSKLRGATVFPALGIWQGLQERSVTVLVMSRKKIDDAIWSLLNKIRVRDKQASVISLKMVGEVIWNGSVPDNSLPDNSL